MQQCTSNDDLIEYQEFNWSVMSFVSEMVGLFRDNPDPQTAILQILKRVGDLYRVDRVYISLFTPDGTKIETALQWHVEDTPALNFSDLINRKDVLHTFQEREICRCDDVSKLDDENAKKFYDTYGVKAGIEYLFIKNGEAFGWIGLHDCHHTRHWLAREIELLQTVAILLRERIHSL